MHMQDKLISWTFKHVQEFSFSNLNTPFILLETFYFVRHGKSSPILIWASYFG